MSSHSHAAIINLLAEIERQASEENFEFKGVKKSNVNSLYGGKLITDVVRSDIKINFESYSLFAGTASFFAKGLDKKVSLEDCKVNILMGN